MKPGTQCIVWRERYLSDDVKRDLLGKRVIVVAKKPKPKMHLEGYWISFDTPSRKKVNVKLFDDDSDTYYSVPVCALRAVKSIIHLSTWEECAWQPKEV